MKLSLIAPMIDSCPLITLIHTNKSWIWMRRWLTIINDSYFRSHHSHDCSLDHSKKEKKILRVLSSFFFFFSPFFCPSFSDFHSFKHFFFRFMMRLRISIRGRVRRSVRRSVRWSRFIFERRKTSFPMLRWRRNLTCSKRQSRTIHKWHQNVGPSVCPNIWQKKMNKKCRRGSCIL